MRGDVAAAFGLAGYGSDGGEYEPTITERVEVDDLSWHDRAACHQRNRPPGVTPAEWVNQFFPHPTQDAEADEVRSTLCAHCPVRAECEEAGRHEREGIWGGGPPRHGLSPHRRGPRIGANGKGWPTATRDEVLRLIRVGVPDRHVEAQTNVPLRTIRDWRRGAGIWRDHTGSVVERGQTIKESA